MGSAHEYHDRQEVVLTKRGRLFVPETGEFIAPSAVPPDFSSTPSLMAARLIVQIVHSDY